MQPDQDIESVTAREVDNVCDRFENAWRSGNRLRIEDCIIEQHEPKRSLLLRQLLLLEWELRGESDQEFSVSDYYGRFPADQRLVQEAFTEQTVQQTRPAVR